MIKEQKRLYHIWLWALAHRYQRSGQFEDNKEVKGAEKVRWL